MAETQERNSGLATPGRGVSRRQVPRRIAALLETSPDLALRLLELRHFARRVKASEYHITNACNIRCQNCWFYEYGFDKTSREASADDAWHELISRERDRGVTSALLIGGEPTLFLNRVRLFVDAMEFVTISSNGLRLVPKEFDRVAIALTLFGGGPLDDELRGIRPNGRRINGLFEKALANYRNDDRATFILALSRESSVFLDETVRRIRDNGNQVTFNFYSGYSTADPLRSTSIDDAFIEEVLAVQQRYRETVVCHPYYVRASLTGKTHWGAFGYETCPSVSISHPDHKERVRNGNPVLPHFNSFAADARSVNFCCTSGHCEGCRDSQAVYSWLLVSLHAFTDSRESLLNWIEIAESYWRQFVWSPFHRRASA